MARIPYPEDRPEGTSLNVARMMGHSPAVGEAWERLGGMILFKGALDARLREIAILRVGHASGSAYEVTHHERIGRAVGMDEAEIAAVRIGGSVAEVSETAAQVIAYADALMASPRAPDALFSALHAKLGPQALVELTLTVGFYWMTARVLETFEVDVDPAPPAAFAARFEGQKAE